MGFYSSHQFAFDRRLVYEYPGGRRHVRQASILKSKVSPQYLVLCIAGHWHDIVIQQIDVEGNVISFEALNKTYASNWTPLWAGLAEPRSSMAVAACKSFERSGHCQNWHPKPTDSEVRCHSMGLYISASMARHFEIGSLRSSQCCKGQLLPACDRLGGISRPTTLLQG